MQRCVRRFFAPVTLSGEYADGRGSPLYLIGGASLNKTGNKPMDRIFG